MTSTLPGIVLVPQVIGGQRGAAEGHEGLREDDHRAATTASMGGLVRVSVGEGTPLSPYHQRSQQPQHKPLVQASLLPATKGWGGISHQPLGSLSTLFPVSWN